LTDGSDDWAIGSLLLLDRGEGDGEESNHACKLLFAKLITLTSILSRTRERKSLPMPSTFDKKICTVVASAVFQRILRRFSARCDCRL
jgi:hypothetical protein